MKTANSIILDLKKLEKMTKKQVKKAIQFLAEKELIKKGFKIGQEVKFCETAGYIITGVRFVDLELKDISIKIERGHNWHDVESNLGYIKRLA